MTDQPGDAVKAARHLPGYQPPGLSATGDLLSDGEKAYQQALEFIHAPRPAEAAAEDMKAVFTSLQAALDDRVTADMERILRARLTRPLVTRQVAAEWRALVSGDVVAWSGMPVEVHFEHPVPAADEIGMLSRHVARHGLAGLSPRQVLLLILVCLFTVGLPFAQGMLPADVQGKVTSEEVALGIGVPLAMAIMEKRGGGKD